MELVSVVIPTYNRYKYVMNTIESVKQQTYKNIEIIVVNDRSTQPEYYDLSWNGVRIIHLEKNTKDIFGYACAAFVRNQRIAIAKGAYIAFCDDDDIWFPQKLEHQIAAMKCTGCQISSTEGLIGEGPYSPASSYLKYNSEFYYKALQGIYRAKGSSVLEAGFPAIWNLSFLKIHNCVICSSVVVEKNLLDIVGNMKHVNNGKEDYDYWLRALEHTDLIYVPDVCFYYDNGHGDGQNY
jgi:glycosyltransferase involved in cell wall biosynthesis